MNGTQLWFVSVLKGEWEKGVGGEVSRGSVESGECKSQKAGTRDWLVCIKPSGSVNWHLLKVPTLLWKLADRALCSGVPGTNSRLFRHLSVFSGRHFQKGSGHLWKKPWTVRNCLSVFVHIFIGQDWGLVEKGLRGCWLEFSQRENLCQCPHHSGDKNLHCSSPSLDHKFLCVPLFLLSCLVPSRWQLLICFLLLVFCLFWNAHKWNIQCVAFWDWLPLKKFF